MSNRGSNSRKQRPDVVIGIHQTGDDLQMVVVRAPSAGQQPRIVLAKSASRSMISQELGTFKGAMVVRVAPLAQTIARMSVVPIAGEAEMSAAVNLMAEAEFPASIPPHRIAAAVLPKVSGEAQTRAALFTAWLGREAMPVIREGVDEQWTTVLGALAALRGDKKGSIIHADRSSSAVAVLLNEDSVQAARVVVDDVSDEIPWERVSAAAVQDLMATSGQECDEATADAIVNEGRWTSHTDWLTGRVTGTLIDAAWLEKYGLPLGAALLVLDDGLKLSALCDMSGEAPKIKRPAIVAIGEWLSQGARPIVVGAAAIALLVGVPFGLSYARYAALQTRKVGLADINSKSGDIKLRAAMYRQLQTARAPMTKLLSDIAGAAPVGVEIVETRLSVDQDIAIRGKATNTEVHGQFMKNLNATKLFAGSIKPTRTESKDGVTEFELSAKLDNPHLPVKASGDFVKSPLAAQLWGDGATNTTMPVGAVRQVTASGKPVVGNNAKPAGAAAAVANDRRPSPSASSSEAPPELTDADIAKMTRSEAMKAWSARAGWVTANGKADPGVKDRVTAERDKLRERMTAAGKEEQGGTK